MIRPMKGLPCREVVASDASASLDMHTKPNMRDLRRASFRTTRQLSTFPYWLKSSNRFFSSQKKDKSPTNISLFCPDGQLWAALKTNWEAVVVGTSWRSELGDNESKGLSDKELNCDMGDHSEGVVMKSEVESLPMVVVPGGRERAATLFSICNQQ